MGRDWTTYLAQVVPAVVALATLLWAIRKDRHQERSDAVTRAAQESGDYVRTSLEGFRSLVAELQDEVNRQRVSANAREEELCREIRRLRLEVTALRTELARHGIDPPVFDVA